MNAQHDKCSCLCVDTLKKTRHRRHVTNWTRWNLGKYSPDRRILLLFTSFILCNPREPAN